MITHRNVYCLFTLLLTVFFSAQSTLPAEIDDTTDWLGVERFAAEEDSPFLYIDEKEMEQQLQAPITPPPEGIKPEKLNYHISSELFFPLEEEEKTENPPQDQGKAKVIGTVKQPESEISPPPPELTPSKNDSDATPSEEEIPTTPQEPTPSLLEEEFPSIFPEIQQQPVPPTPPPLPERTETVQSNEELPKFDPTLGKEGEIGKEEVVINEQERSILINFNNVQILEFIRFISRLSGQNFIFDETELDFKVTIISEEPTSIEHIMATLMHELRIHNLTMIEEGDNIIIHRSEDQQGIAKVVADGIPENPPEDAELITRVFVLKTLTPERARTILTPLLSSQAVVEALAETNQLIVTDLRSSIDKVDLLVRSLDSPLTGLIIGQYTAKNIDLNTLIKLGQEIITPIANNQTIHFVPHSSVNSILIVSTPYLVDRSIAILRYLDENPGVTGIQGEALLPREDLAPPFPWQIGPDGKYIFPLSPFPGLSFDPNVPPKGRWRVRPDGSWYFEPAADQSAVINPHEMPRGKWRLRDDNVWIFELDPDETFQATTVGRPPVTAGGIPLGAAQAPKFYIYKLKNRVGEKVLASVQKVAASMQLSGAAHGELVSAINSMQLMEDAQSLVFSGTEDSLLKVRELILEIDIPERQVFLEVLVLQTSLSDSLTYSAQWASEYGGGDTAGTTSFLNGPTLNQALTSARPGSTPDAAGLRNPLGFSLGVIGRTLSKNGTIFDSLTLLVQALHTKNRNNVLINPKLIVEDKGTATLFVGQNRQFPSQTIGIAGSQNVSQNFEFQDVGTTLTITPRINDNNIISLDITLDISRVSSPAQANSSATVTATNNSNTTTTVNVPDKYFLILSGLIDNEETVDRNQVPCLGAIPFIGAAFSDRSASDTKQNLMIFIRPHIIDTPEKVQEVTGRQQEVFIKSDETPTRENYEVDGALDWLNVGTPAIDQGPFGLH